MKLQLLSQTLLLCAVLPPNLWAQKQPDGGGDPVDEGEGVGSTTKKPPTVFAEGKPLGRLCEEENDEVGQKLGCDCKLNKGNNLADCSERTIKIGSEALPLPTKLNVSSHIRILDLSSNLLEVINESTFGDVAGVEELNLSKNKIRSVENLAFPRLSRLHLCHNQITNLSSTVFEKVEKIQFLDLSHNQLTHIDPDAFSRLEYLQVLKLAYNRLENDLNWMEAHPFVLRNLSKLEELDLTNGSLPDLPPEVLDGTTHLRKLILKNNLFSILPTDTFARLPYLEELDLSGNYFTHLPSDGFTHLASLKRLTINHNAGLKVVMAHAFSGLSSLQTLSCENNYQLSEIHALAFRGNPEKNSSDSNPKVVQLGYNNLKHFEYPLLHWPSMEELELYGNPWACDCNLQWVADFTHRAAVNASILIDSDFKCASPKILLGSPVAAVDPDEMSCESEIAMLAGVIAITVFSFCMITFVILVGLYHFELLPPCFDKVFGMFGSTPPRYHKVQPKPAVHRRLGVNRVNPEVPPDLDWDTGDIGISHY